jgi:hypothetical protein
VPNWEKQALEEERAARPPYFQWMCPRYELTWSDLAQYLRRRFPNETFEEFQVSLLASLFVQPVRLAVRVGWAATNMPHFLAVGRLLDLQRARKADKGGP